MNGKLLANLDSPVACMLALMTVLSILTFSRLCRDDFDPSVFVVAGDRYSNPREVPQGLAVLENSDGYDGQFYYRLALDPFTSKVTDSGITLDKPSYRHQRFLYPFIVRLTSLGNDRLVPVAMIGTNFLFFSLFAWISGKFAQTLNRHALWGLLIVCNPGFLFTYTRDLVEIVELTFLLGSLLLMRHDQPVRATALLTLAVLTRETSILLAVAAALVFATNMLLKRSERRIPWYYAAVPLCAFCLMQLALFINWGYFPVGAGGPILGNVPLTGWTDPLPDASGRAVAAHWFNVAALTFLVLYGLGVLYQLFLTKAESWEILGCLLYGALVASVGASVWVEDVAFLRVFTHFYVLGAIILLASRVNAVTKLLCIVASAAWTMEFCRLADPLAMIAVLRRYFGVA